MAQVLDIQVDFTHHSARVKSLDVHPTKPWILASLHAGTVSIFDYTTKVALKSIEITDKPVRSAKFIADKNWIVTGADDMFIRVYDSNTFEKIKEFEAHEDYIRTLAVHPTLPYVLSGSDDLRIKLWDWEKDWSCSQTFEDHTHYVMQVVFDPENQTSFASASLDGSVKVWNLEDPNSVVTLEGHAKGVNCVGYFINNNTAYLLSGSDDFTAKVWDLKSVSCIATLEGHTNNVVAVTARPEDGIIVTGSEDGTIRFWDINAYKLLEKTLDHGLGRVWALEFLKGSSQIAIGYDEGLFLGKVAKSA
ncbi:Coatomer subunit beta'-1-like protein [Drosera capensis]